MLFNSLECVQRDLNLQKRLLKKYETEAADLPEGRLTVSRKGDRCYFEKVTLFRGRKRVKYLGSGLHLEVQQLQKKYFLKRSIEEIKKNILLMEKFLENYRSIDPNIMQKSFPAAYQALPQTCFDTAGVFNLEEWGRAEYHRSSKHPENLTHISSKGDYVRSKSEVIIGNALKVRGLIFRYEELTDIGGYMKAPDFKIIHPVTHRIIYWEHCGLLSDPEYLRNMFYKIRDYISQGIIPGVNLILTFDDADGNIDSLMIERTIDLWFGPAKNM